jgi:hypothetical protein
LSPEQANNTEICEEKQGGGERKIRLTEDEENGRSVTRGMRRMVSEE